MECSLNCRESSLGHIHISPFCGVAGAPRLDFLAISALGFNCTYTVMGFLKFPSEHDTGRPLDCQTLPQQRFQSELGGWHWEFLEQLTLQMCIFQLSAFHLETQDRTRNLYGDENSVHNTRSAAWFVIGFISKIFEYEKIH